MAKSKKPAASVPVDAHKHVADSRTNIPTRELAEFAADGIGKAVYRRDRSLDPQFVWKRKDEQDAKGALEVPAVPIYVQEKIHPRAIVDDVKARAASRKGAQASGGTGDVACWYIDTDYDEKSFFVRHAYFLGADEPYEKLKKALRAEIDEGEWSKLYSATSQPFDAPARGKIAVKVINHFGDEVLKVCPVPAQAAGKSK